MEGFERAVIWWDTYGPSAATFGCCRWLWLPDLARRLQSNASVPWCLASHGCIAGRCRSSPGQGRLGGWALGLTPRPGQVWRANANNAATQVVAIKASVLCAGHGSVSDEFPIHVWLVQAESDDVAGWITRMRIDKMMDNSHTRQVVYTPKERPLPTNDRLHCLLLSN